MRRIAVIVLLAWTGAALSAAASLPLLRDGRIDDWMARSFQGETRYATVRVGGVAALEARAEGAASGLFREDRVSLAEWPVLRWRWRVAATLDNRDERSREGDDFVARIYVVARHPLLPWKRRAVCYVWAASAGPGESWASPFSDDVRMIALRNGASRAGEWHEERRDLVADFRRLFGDAPDTIAAVAIMTDTDQTGASATAWYEGLRFEHE